MEDKFNKMTMRYSVSVREYFMILRLAIHHITGDYIEKSVGIAQYEKSDEVYKCACDLLLALQKKERRKNG